MANTLTDQHNMVTTTIVEGGFLFWGPIVNYNDGFLRVTFRAGRYTGSITSYNDTLRAHNGDTLLTINQGPVSLPFKGTLRTSDSFTCTYDAIIEISITNPVPFAICYLQQNDPLAKAYTTVQEALAREAERSLHENLQAVDLRHVVESDIRTTEPEYGIKVLRAERFDLTRDPNWQRRLEGSRDREHERIQNVRDKEVELLQRGMEQVQAGNLDIHKLYHQSRKDEISRLLRAGYTWEDIKRDFPTLLDSGQNLLGDGKS